jgi:hypothetical protein
MQNDPEAGWGRTTVTNAAELETARMQSAEEEEGARSSSIEGAIGVAIEALAGPTITEHTIDDPFVEMQAYLASGDHVQALELAELVLADDPANPDARACRERCRGFLEQRYAWGLSPLDRIPVLTPAASGRDVQAIDHRARFLLSLVDGSSSLETIVDGCGMPRLDALRILHDLFAEGIIANQ